MPEFKDEFKFPDEADQEAEKQASAEAAAGTEDEFEIEVEDDTPEQDRNRQPLPKDVVENLEKDELEDYSEKVKVRLMQMKKVWHDERRAKEAALREQQAAIDAAQRLVEENKRLKSKLSTGEEALVSSFKQTVERELEMAKREYKDAYDAGDADRLVEAQQKIAAATVKADRINNFKPAPLQEEKFDVQSHQEVQAPQKRDPKAVAWQERNTWFGQDDEMTSLALGLHEKLVKENGLAYATTDEYYNRIDSTMRKRFPEYYEESSETKTAEAEKPVRTKPSTVVAPATRSTSSKKVRLTQTQVQIAKKLGLTPEQYVRELMKMEA